MNLSCLSARLWATRHRNPSLTRCGMHLRHSIQEKIHDSMMGVDMSGRSVSRFKHFKNQPFLHGVVSLCAAPMQHGWNVSICDRSSCGGKAGRKRAFMIVTFRANNPLMRVVQEAYGVLVRCHWRRTIRWLPGPQCRNTGPEVPICARNRPQSTRPRVFGLGHPAERRTAASLHGDDRRHDVAI